MMRKQSFKKSDSPRKGNRKEEDSKKKNFKDSKPPRSNFKKENSPKPKPIKINDDGSMRLNKYIAASGICSRREADMYITTGCVEVNGKLVTELGVKVQKEDVVKFNGEKIKSEKKVYILLNKPKDYITTSDDPDNRKTVFELIKNAGPERVYSVGRLDRNTTGVLLFTNDGELTTKLTHPKFNKKKIYHVFLDKKLSSQDMLKIEEGLTLDDGPVSVDQIEFTNPSDKREVGLEIHSGRNRIVRRIFEHLSYKVVKLDRVYFCGLTKKNLPRGKWRFLNEDEISMLKRGAFE